MTEEVIEGARLAARAVEFGKGDGNVLWMSAYAILHLAMDASRAKEIASLSLVMNPNSAMAVTCLAWIETSNGNPARGLELFRRVERLSPRDPRGWLISSGVASANYFEGRFDEAVLWAQNALIRNPRFAHALRILAASLAREGKVGEAAAAVRQVLDIEPDLTVTKLRTRLMFMDDWCWSRLAHGLRAAGLPE